MTTTTFMNKIETLVQALVLAIFGGYNTKVATMFDDVDDAMSYMTFCINGIASYAYTKVVTTMSEPIWRQRYDGMQEQLLGCLQDARSSRKIAYDSAVACIGMLNRLSGDLGLAPFMDVDTAYRSAVDEAVLEFVNEAFYADEDSSIDAAVKKQLNAGETPQEPDVAALMSKFD